MSDRWDGAFRAMLASVDATGRPQVGFVADPTQTQAAVSLRLDLGSEARARSIGDRLPPSGLIGEVSGQAEVAGRTVRLKLVGASPRLWPVVEDMVSEVGGEQRAVSGQPPGDPFERVLRSQATIRGIVIDHPEHRRRWDAVLGSEAPRSSFLTSPQLHRRTGEDREHLRILWPCASNDRAAAIARLVATMVMHADIGGLEEELGQTRGLCYSPRMGAINIGTSSLVMFEATSAPGSEGGIAKGLYAVAARSVAALEQDEHHVAMLRGAVLFGLLDEGSVHGDVTSLLRRWTFEEGGVAALLSLPSALRRTTVTDVGVPLRNMMAAIAAS